MGSYNVVNIGKGNGLLFNVPKLFWLLFSDVLLHLPGQRREGGFSWSAQDSAPAAQSNLKMAHYDYIRRSQKPMSYVCPYL